MAPEPELEAVLFLNGINPLSQLALPQTSAADLGNTVPINSLTAAWERVHTSRFFCVLLPLSISWENTPAHQGSGKQTRVQYRV